MTAVSPEFAEALRDRYVLERELGRGGMATVYLARDVRLDRPVALKVLHPELARAVGPDRFVREIRLTARLQHPHILPVHDSGETAGLLWYTMPFVEGESLRQRLAREPQLPLADAVRITREVAAALGYAHRHGIVHRDVKPENILLQGDGCMLADFGVARALDAAGGRLTETGLAMGTPAYMSPEQATAGQVDARSDVYALGCVVYEMLAGEPPFTGRTARALIARRLTESVPDLCLVRDVPRDLEQVVRTALARAPADRYPDAPTFARALEAAAGEPATTAPRDSASALRTRASPLRRPRALAAAGVPLVAAAAIALFLASRPSTDAARDPNLLVVAPFEVFDPDLEVWREGLGDILSRTLDGAGPIRTVSPTVVHRTWRGRSDRAAAEELGRRTGAGLVVYGAAVPHGPDSLTLRASLLDDAGGSAKTDIEVSGEGARIGELADSLSFRVLRALSPSRPIGSVRRVSIGSRSLPALKAFLQGEQFYRRGLWDSAVSRYDRAIQADTTFAPALRRMSMVLGWHPPSAAAYPPADDYARRSTLHNHGLPARESLLIASDSFRFAAMAATDPEALVTLQFRSLGAIEEAVRRYPDDPEAWYVLGETRYHAPWPIRRPPSALLDIFARAVELDSGFAPAYEHMPAFLLQLGRPEQARRYAATYLALQPLATGAPEMRLAAAALDPSSAGAAAMQRLIDAASVRTLFGATVNTLFFWPDSAESAVRLTRHLSDPGRPAGGGAQYVLDSLMWRQYLAFTLAFRGHLREAYEVNQRLMVDASAADTSWFLDPFLDLTLLGIVPESLARATFARSLEPTGRWGNRATPRYLGGLPWWLARGDTASLARFSARAQEVVHRAEAPMAMLRARLLGSLSDGYLALARGDSAEALRRLSAIPDTLCLADPLGSACFDLNLTRSRLLAARGEDRPAGELLDHWRWSTGPGPQFVLATLELGRIAERLGDRAKAAECYGFVAAAWRRPDRELLPYVEEAREALVRLGDE